MEVRAWLESYVPRDLLIPPDGSPLDLETQARVKQFRREMGAKGWLAPSWPKQYGGGGLSPAFAEVVQERCNGSPCHPWATTAAGSPP